MAQKNSSKRISKTTGVKALIATASVAATLVGWALLPANDPQATAATSASQQPALNAPDNTDTGSGDTLPQMPSIEQPTSPSSGDQLPQVQAPSGFSNFPRPFTGTHSSR